MPLPAPGSPRSHPEPVAPPRAFPRWLLPAVLAVAIGLRVWLALEGGQYFFGDEGRYDRGIQLYQSLASGDLTGIQAIIAQPEHALFAWVGAGVTALQHLLAQFTPYGHWSNSGPASLTIGLGAAVLSLFSALNLYLLYRLALVLGADETEATWATLLMAASNTAFYYARHLLPYDCAISFALAALIVGLGRPTHWRSLGCGLLVGLTYHVYNGYWYLVPVLWFAYGLGHRRDPRFRPLVLACAGGVALGLLLPVLAGLAAGGAHYLATTAAFSRSVTQGVFAEGWSLPWEYFWHAEGLFGVGVVTVFLLGAFPTRHSGRPLPQRVVGILIAGALAYGLLVLLSVGLERFVVYARTVKPFVPLFCLLGGWGLGRLVALRPSLRPLALAALALTALLHFSPHFMQVFPRETEIAVLRSWGNPKRSLSVAGSLYIPLALPVSRPDLALVNAQLLYPVRAYRGFPAGRTVLEVGHALSYPPFQYESHTPRERTLLRTHDISIRLIKLDAPASLPDDLPPAERFRPADRPTGR